MLYKKFTFICRYRRFLIPHDNILLLHRASSSVINHSTKLNTNKKELKFVGPSLKDFIAKDLPTEQKEFLNDEDKIPYVDMADLGQNRKGNKLVFGFYLA